MKLTRKPRPAREKLTRQRVRELEQELHGIVQKQKVQDAITQSRPMRTVKTRKG